MMALRAQAWDRIARRGRGVTTCRERLFEVDVACRLVNYQAVKIDDVTA